MRVAVLSAPILIEEGRWAMRKTDLRTAKILAQKAVNYCGHETVKILGLEPAKTREQCPGYDIAIVVKPRQRLDFGREYTLGELERIGYDIFIISRIVG